MVRKEMAKLVKDGPSRLRNPVTSLAVVNNCKVKGAVDEGVRIEKTDPLPERAEALRDCICR